MVGPQGNDIRPRSDVTRRQKRRGPRSAERNRRALTGRAGEARGARHRLAARRATSEVTRRLAPEDPQRRAHARRPAPLPQRLREQRHHRGAARSGPATLCTRRSIAAQTACARTPRREPAHPRMRRCRRAPPACSAGARSPARQDRGARRRRRGARGTTSATPTLTTGMPAATSSEIARSACPAALKPRTASAALPVPSRASTSIWAKAPGESARAAVSPMPLAAHHRDEAAAAPLRRGGRDCLARVSGSPPPKATVDTPAARALRRAARRARRRAACARRRAFR